MSDEKYFQLGCCGVRWYKDWDLADLTITSTNITHLGLTAQSVPDSCCRVDVVGCGRNILSVSLEEVSNIHNTEYSPLHYFLWCLTYNTSTQLPSLCSLGLLLAESTLIAL